MDWQAAVDGLLQPAAVLAGTPADTLQVLLYGAGHVGRALVEVLGRLPVAIRWIDHRPDAFPATVPPNTACVPCAEPAAAVGAEAAGAAVLIMTPEHGLDLALTRLWLQRGDFRFLGVIGSQHKRRQFAALLRRQGVDEAMLSRLVCPIGLGPVGGKEPEVIAVAVAAQLMQLRRLPHAQGASPVRDPGSTNT
jgi:xanthine dehydrogenase accessory factor